ncbi:imidazolonepropionase [Sphingomonas parva]|uniref:Imidazolonepropionase n=1 Tax=Sphingomonas parva TaxID=2555898 RepID=A0A4Y8ZT38_9SPHN|nr:imidazolonepropionase [Sphingomonas parva]TFI58462.1 imidazolonepropionase [Sphingomonas parva]
MESPDLILRNCSVATMTGSGYGAVRQAAIVIRDNRLIWVGAETSLPSSLSGDEVDLAGRWVTPGLIDCHTHLVFGRNRADEFEMRPTGVSYEEIAKRGGGIASTVAATRAASMEELIDAALPRLRRLLADGVTTIEIKSGYGLDVENELKMLRAARALGSQMPVRVQTTFLGLHALPREYADRQDAYVDVVVGEMLPAIAEEGLADAVDAYVEKIAFSPAQAERFFEAAACFGLPAKVHADQLSASGGAKLAGRLRALSADHVEHADEASVTAMADANVTAVLLPGAYLCMRETKKPPIELLRQHQVSMAVATDCNPGTSPMPSLLLAMNLSSTLFDLAPAEALAGATRNAAKALGLTDRGTIEIGKLADLAVWDISGPAELSYWTGHSLLHSRYVGGERAS